MHIPFGLREWMTDIVKTLVIWLFMIGVFVFVTFGIPLLMIAG
jgi:hypothetical protein